MGNGWLEPEVEDAIDFRRSRGRRSWLNVPIENQQDHTFVFRARAELLGVHLTLRVDVNGRTIGTTTLSEGWAEYAFDAPEHSLVVGLNTVTLLYSDTPWTLDPDFRGRNTSIALDWVRFEPDGTR